MDVLNSIKDLANGNGSWITLLFAFAILPALYLRFAFDTQKEYVDLAKTIFTNTTLNQAEKRRLGEWSEQSVHAFQLEWGLIGAIAVLILANFCSIFVVDLSSLAKNGCVAIKATVSTAQPSVGCEKVKSLLSIYSIVTILAIFFRLQWEKVAAIRRLRELYFELALNQTRQPISPLKDREAIRAQPAPNGTQRARAK